MLYTLVVASLEIDHEKDYTALAHHVVEQLVQVDAATPALVTRMWWRGEVLEVGIARLEIDTIELITLHTHRHGGCEVDLVLICDAFWQRGRVEVWTDLVRPSHMVVARILESGRCH